MNRELRQRLTSVAAACLGDFGQARALGYQFVSKSLITSNESYWRASVCHLAGLGRSTSDDEDRKDCTEAILNNYEEWHQFPDIWRAIFGIPSIIGKSWLLKASCPSWSRAVWSELTMLLFSENYPAYHHQALLEVFEQHCLQWPWETAVTHVKNKKCCALLKLRLYWHGDGDHKAWPAMCSNLRIPSSFVNEYLNLYQHKLSESDLKIWLTTRATHAERFQCVTERYEQQMLDTFETCLEFAHLPIELKRVVLQYCVHACPPPASSPTVRI